MPRAIWRGHLRISLVTIPVQLYTATESSKTIQLNRLHKNCGQRVRNQLKCPVHGELDSADVVKGYEYEKDHYAIIEDEELQQIKLSTDKVIDVQQFADAAELEVRYYDRPYYLGPDGPVAEQTYRMVREALSKEQVVAIGKVVISSREHVVSIAPLEKGLVMMTLRSAEEVRPASEHFHNIDESKKLDSKQVELARQLIGNMRGPLDLSQYKDRYQQKLTELVEAKVAGRETVALEEEPEAAPVDITEALRQSLERAEKRKPPAPSVKTRRKPQRKKKRA